MTEDEYFFPTKPINLGNACSTGDNGISIDKKDLTLYANCNFCTMKREATKMFGFFVAEDIMRICEDCVLAAISNSLAVPELEQRLQRLEEYLRANEPYRYKHFDEG